MTGQLDRRLGRVAGAVTGRRRDATRWDLAVFTDGELDELRALAAKVDGVPPGRRTEALFDAADRAALARLEVAYRLRASFRQPAPQKA